MILADKIITLRKKEGWSQEELAEKLGVSRQSVSKWEGAQSIPDINKILQLSSLFGVSTDYLLKDDQEELEYVAEEPAGDARRSVSMEEANEYLEIIKQVRGKIALGTFLCIISPITMILLAGFSELEGSILSEDAAGGIGLCALLLIIATAVAIFIIQGSKTKHYEYLDKEEIELAYGVAGMVKEQKKQTQSEFTKGIVAGTVLCILSVVPIAAVSIFDPANDIYYIIGVCFLLFFVGLGACMLVDVCTYRNALERLLEEGDYTRAKKKKVNIKGAISTVYWCLATVIYLLMLFGPGYYEERSWIVWPVAGVLFGAVMAIARIFDKE